MKVFAFDGDVELLQEAIRSLFRFGHRHLRRSRLRATASIIGHASLHRDRITFHASLRPAQQALEERKGTGGEKEG